MIKKINLFDLFITLALILLIIFGILFFTYQEKVLDTRLNVTLVVTTPEAGVIYDTAKKQPTVYFNSVNKEVQVENVTINSKGQLEIELFAPGEVQNEVYIFNGQRILIGQKAEIHSSYFAQGYIKDVSLKD